MNFLFYTSLYFLHLPSNVIVIVVALVVGMNELAVIDEAHNDYYDNFFNSSFTMIFSPRKSINSP